MKRKSFHLNFKLQFIIIILVIYPFALLPSNTKISLRKWERHLIKLPNNTYSGNPFELEVDAVFIHTHSGTKIKLPGYYAGHNIWKIRFMPNKIGEWKYRTFSKDSDLDGKIGTIDCVPSDHPGMLKGDTIHKKKWKFTDGPYAVPIAFRFYNLFQEPGSVEKFVKIADFLKNQVRGHMLEGQLSIEGCSPHFPFMEGSPEKHKFNLSRWELFEERMEILSERGLGYHLMFYSDDAGKPTWGPISATEKLIIRYVIARLAAYPVIWFNSGVDILEYRSEEWVNWFGEQVRALDPYGHPVSSRVFIQQGSEKGFMADRTWDSRVDVHAKIAVMSQHFKNSPHIPVSMDDAWHENSRDGRKRKKDYSKHDIRRAIWKCVMAGGLGCLIRGSVHYCGDGYFRIANFEKDLESEQYIRHINPFIQLELGNTFGKMVPANKLVSGDGCYCLADPERKKILYFSLGKNDRYDNGSGEKLTAHLTGISGSFIAIWFDPRTGKKSYAGIVSGDNNVPFKPPSTDDWILLLSRKNEAKNYLKK